MRAILHTPDGEEAIELDEGDAPFVLIGRDDKMYQLAGVQDGTCHYEEAVKRDGA